MKSARHGGGASVVNTRQAGPGPSPGQQRGRLRTRGPGSRPARWGPDRATRPFAGLWVPRGRSLPPGPPLLSHFPDAQPGPWVPPIAPAGVRPV